MKKDFNVAMETKKVIEWIQVYFKNNKSAKGAILGISGGKDSTVVSALLVEALGKDRVYGVLLPNGVQKDISDSLKVVKDLDIKYSIVNIADSFNGLVDNIQEFQYLSDQSLINIAPRIRMATLYAIGQTLGYRVCGTGNKSESYVGYTTKFGDSSSDFNPISDFDTEEVIAIGDYLGISHNLVHKIPSDGLCAKSDEENLGFTYHQLNEYMDNGTCGDKKIDMDIFWKHEASLHKFNPIPTFKKIIIQKGDR
ncbi:NAD(+) synthase [Clostridium tagluense]|uniref:NH(3)-dependent NAD(+) synthetase n=1 Tax=Clostridium tagluense TaxID=360422 RepID=A0A401UQ90_9CLOT|nr:NAD(+) synthase [Clostridium tagluense]GCD11699.1 NAD(+) synthetase [Clostridium tagluense]